MNVKYFVFGAIKEVIEGIICEEGVSIGSESVMKLCERRCVNVRTDGR